MAQCVQNKKSGEVLRLSNAEAALLVKNGDYRPTSKGKWRKLKRKNER